VHQSEQEQGAEQTESLCGPGTARYNPRMNNQHHPPNHLLAAPPRVVNVGLELFATDLKAIGAQVVHVQWSPPAGGNARLAGLLEKLRKA
jgi:hypothetical protein